ncbi:MAG: biotin/lipoyl-containing protein [Lentimicrobium sp.]|jgi:biotin carboxyl carrier protein|nr:biotin/lipoyl-containing protein [Lentimicrobium sp.]
MALEINIDGRTAGVTELKRDGNMLTIQVDDEIYEVDALKVGEGIYSLLYKGKSYNIEMIENASPRHYTVNSRFNTYELEVIDAQSRYRASRSRGTTIDAGNTIISPMPGKVVKIPVKVGESVEAGQTLIIVSAMKMESEFKARKAGVVKSIHAKEGDTIDANKVLVVVEEGQGDDE